MLIKDKQCLKNLITDLSNFIREEKTELFALNRKITLDTDHWITEDYQTVVLYLKNYIKNHVHTEIIDKIKPKGKVLIILSYNEPLVLSIIPVLNALIVGNDVVLKTSRNNEDFVRFVWQKSGLAEKYGLKLEVVSLKTPDEISDFIKKVRAVYFFGSYRVAQVIAKTCGENYIEFYPEIETSDSKVFNKKSSHIKNDACLTLEESFTHSGQICQRIQGVFVQNKLFDEYVKILKKEFMELCQSVNLNKFITDDYSLARSEMLGSLFFDIEKSRPNEIVRVKDLPLLVISPKQTSDFVKNAYFLPVLWISSFDSKEELIKILNSRRFFLGINIQSDKSTFTDYIINNTKFTRYTVNTSHTNIRSQEGWGGSWPSGYSGYRNWIEHFSDGYVIINDFK